MTPRFFSCSEMTSRSIIDRPRRSSAPRTSSSPRDYFRIFLRSSSESGGLDLKRRQIEKTDIGESPGLIFSGRAAAMIRIVSMLRAADRETNREIRAISTGPERIGRGFGTS